MHEKSAYNAAVAAENKTETSIGPAPGNRNLYPPHVRQTMGGLWFR